MSLSEAGLPLTAFAATVDCLLSRAVVRDCSAFALDWALRVLVVARLCCALATCFDVRSHFGLVVRDRRLERVLSVLCRLQRRLGGLLGARAVGVGALRVGHGDVRGSNGLRVVVCRLLVGDRLRLTGSDIRLR